MGVVAPPVPHHYVITVALQPAEGQPRKDVAYEGVVLWHYGETRQDQYCKVTQFVSQDLRKEGHTGGFVTKFWSLERNQL